MAKHDPSLDALFAALSDPTRRAVVHRLAAGPASASTLAEPFDMALPTFMAHLAKLEAANLITTRKQGRSRICSATANGLAPAQDWITQARDLWNARLDQLEDYLDSLPDPKAPK